MKFTIEIDPELAPMAHVIVDALEKMQQRDRKRRGVWRRSGLKGQVFHLFAKSERAFTRVQRGELPDEDDFLDLINYAVFAEILRRTENLNGSWPW